MQLLVRAGLLLVVAMQVVFVLAGADRGALYEAVNGAGVVVTLALVWALPSGSLVLAGAAFALLFLLRVANVLLALTRIALPVSLLMALGWALASWGCFRRERGALVAGLFVLGAAYFAAMGTTLSGGRLSAILALAAGSVGFFLAAPNVSVPSGGRADRSG